MPVIYLTAHSDYTTLERAKLTEPFGFMLKPFEERELSLHIEMALYKYQAQRKLRKLNRTLRALSHHDQALLHATDEAAFLTEVCRIIVEVCGHPLVWVGYAEDNEAKSVRPVAYSGFDAGYLDTMQLTWADTERPRTDRHGDSHRAGMRLSQYAVRSGVSTLAQRGDSSRLCRLDSFPADPGRQSLRRPHHLFPRARTPHRGRGEAAY